MRSLLLVIRSVALACACGLASACGSGSSAPVDAGPDASPPPPIDAAIDADPYADPLQVELRLIETLDDLANLGNKRAGSLAAEQTSTYLVDRFVAAGLEDVHLETFRFPVFNADSSSLVVTTDGASPVVVAHEPLAYSGVGTVDAELVYADHGHASDYAGIDATGKIVVVRRDDFFHRAAQFNEVLAHGGAAMLYVSASPNNLIQIGTVADPEDGLAPLPALTIGQDDGDAIQAALAAGSTVRATITVDASISPGVGRNVIGRLPGTDPSGAYVLLGAHYDTWYVGAVDNSSGTAALVETAEALATRPRRLGIVFVAYDGEEVGLFGGYDYLRDHVVAGGEPMLGFFNFEMPASGEADPRALAYTTGGGAFENALVEASISDLYTSFVGLSIVPMLFGGLIPTDIQGMYRAGFEGFTTFCSTPYYHTPEDTPDKLDTAFLASAVIRFEETFAYLDDDDLAAFQVRDPALWSLQVSAGPPSPDSLVDVVVRDGQGMLRANANVTVWLDVDDFTRVHSTTTTTDAAGSAQVTIPAAALAQGTGDRWIHVTAGSTFPLAEAIVPAPAP